MTMMGVVRRALLEDMQGFDSSHCSVRTPRQLKRLRAISILNIDIFRSRPFFFFFLHTLYYKRGDLISKLL